MQKYQSGEEVRIGDRVRRHEDDGKIVALQEDLPQWGIDKDRAAGMAMIEFNKMKLMCENTASNEDLIFVGRADS